MYQPHSLCRTDYWKNKFDEANGSKSFWKVVNEFQEKKKHSKIGPLINSEKQSVVENDLDKANLLNHHFATIGKILNADTDTNINTDLIYRVTPSVQTLNYSYELYEKCFDKCVKVGKACGPDEIKPKFLKLIGPESCGLHEVMKKSTQQLKYPSNWKTGKVSCIFKKGSHTDCNNYRPIITLLSVPSKILENVICDQMDNHLNEHNLINDHQWGFREKRSTESILLKMTETWMKAIDENKVVGILFIDFEKAFDCINHKNSLKKKLLGSGISGDNLSILSSYLENRSQFTCVNGHS